MLRIRACAARSAVCHRVFAILLSFTLVPMLTGCITVDRPDVGVDIPPKYRAGNGVSAPPALDWWRGFRSSELTKLMEEAQAENFDIGAAIARIQQADAQSKVAGAALFPSVNFDATATRTRSSQAGTSGLSGGGGGSERVSYQAAFNAS